MSNVVGTVEFDVRLNLDQFNKEIARIKNQKLPCISICFDIPDNFEKKIAQSVKSVTIPVSSEKIKPKKTSNSSLRENDALPAKKSLNQQFNDKKTIKEDSLGRKRDELGRFVKMESQPFSSNSIGSVVMGTATKTVNNFLKEIILDISQQKNLFTKAIFYALDGVTKLIKATDQYKEISNQITNKVNTAYQSFLAFLAETAKSNDFMQSSVLKNNTKQSNYTKNTKELNIDSTGIVSSIVSSSKLLTDAIATSKADIVSAIDLTSNDLTNTLNQLFPKQSLFAKVLSSISATGMQFITGKQSIENIQRQVGTSIKNIQLIPGGKQVISGVERLLPSRFLDTIKHLPARSENNSLNNLNIDNLHEIIDIFAELSYISDDLTNNFLKLNAVTIDVSAQSFFSASDVSASFESYVNSIQEAIKEGEDNINFRKKQYAQIKNKPENIDLTEILSATMQSSQVRSRLKTIKNFDDQQPEEKRIMAVGSLLYQKYLDILRQIGQYDAFVIKKIEKILPKIEQNQVELVTQIEEVTGKRIKNRKKNKKHSNDFADNGQSIVEGIESGIIDRSASLENVASEIFSTIDNQVRTDFDIHSPSGWGVNIGLNIVTGISNGIVESSNALLSYLSKIYLDANNALQEFSRNPEAQEKLSQDILNSVDYAKSATKLYFDNTEYQGHVFSLMADALTSVQSEFMKNRHKNAQKEEQKANIAIQKIRRILTSLETQKQLLQNKQQDISNAVQQIETNQDNLIVNNKQKLDQLKSQLNSSSNLTDREEIAQQIEMIGQQQTFQLQAMQKDKQMLLDELNIITTELYQNINSIDKQEVELKRQEFNKRKNQQKQNESVDAQSIIFEESNREKDLTFTSAIDKFDELFPELKEFITQGIGFLGSLETFQSMLGTAINFVKESLDQVLSLLTDREVLKGLMPSGQEYQKIQSFLDGQINTFNLDRKVVENGFKNFYAASVGTNLEGDPVQDIFAGVTQASRAYNLTSEQQQGAFLALTQMMSRGTISMEELRGQLSERLPGAMAIAARAMNMTQGELVELVSSGQLAADVFLPKFAQQLKNETAGAAESASGSLRAIQQEYDNIFLNFRVKVIEAIEPGLKLLGKGIIEVINVGRKLLPLIGFMAGVTFLNSLEGIVGFIKTIGAQLLGIVGLGPLLGTVGAAMASPLVALLPILAQVFEIKQWIGLFTLYLPIITTLMDGLNAKLEIFGVTLYQSESDKTIEKIANSAKKLKETLNASTTAANKLGESTSEIKSVSPIDDKLRWDNKSSEAEIRKGEFGAIKDLSYIGGAFAFDIARSDYHSYDQEIRRKAQLDRAITEAFARGGIDSPKTRMLSNASPEFLDEYFYAAATSQVEKPKYMKSYDKITALTTFGLEKDFNKLNRKIYKGFDKFTDNLLKTLGALPAKVRGRNLIAEGGTAVLSGLNLPLTRGGQSTARAVSRIPGGAAASRGIGQLVKALTNGFKPLIAATSKLTNRFLLSAISVTGVVADLALMAKASFAPFLPTLSAVLVAMVQFAVLFGVIAAAALVFNKAVSWMKGQGGKTITLTQVQEEWRIKDNEKANKASNQIVDEILKSLNDYKGGTGVLAEAKLNNQRIQQLTFESGNLSDADPRKQQINEQLQQLNLSKDMLDEKINQMKASNLDVLQALESQLETEKNPQLIGSLKTQIALIKKTQTMLEVAEAEASNSSAVKGFALALRDLNNSFESIAAQFEIYATRLDIAISKQQIEDFSDPNARFLETKLNVQRKEQELGMSQSKLESQKKSAILAQSQISSQAEFGNVQKILRSEIAQLGIDTTGTNMNNFDEMIQLLSFDQISALQERYTDASIQQNLELVASYREKQSEILFGEQELYTKTLELMQAKEAAEMESINSRYDDATKTLQLAASKEEAIIRQKVLDEKITQQDAQLQIQQLEKANNAKAIKLTEEKLQAIKSAHSRGIISTDTYVSESMSLEQQLADEKKQLIESQIALQEAVQQKVLDEMEKALQKANAKLEQSQNHQIAIIRKAQLDRKITEAQAEESLAQLAVDRANAEIQIKQKQLEELRKARAKGFVTESEFASRERDLITELSAANVQRLQEELALRNAIKERILDDLERANAIAEAAITKKTTSDKQESIQTQITEYRTIGDRVDDVASQKALESERNALLDQEQLRTIAVANNQKMLNLGLLTHEEYVDKQITAEQELADIRTQLLENQLSQQKELANFTISEIERAISESNAAIDKLQSQRSAVIKGEQLAGGDKSVRLAATTAEIAQSESDLDATQDKLQAVEQQIASIQDAYSQGVISQQTYNDKMTEAEQQLADLRSQNFDQLIGLQQQLADAAIAELERVVQVTERALEGSRTNAEIEIRTNEAAQTQTLGSDVAGQNAEIELNKVERQQSIEKIRLAERELAEIARLRRESILDEETANDRLADGQNKLAQLKLDLIQQEMSARRLAADKAIAELERVKQAVERNLERNQTISKIQIRQTEAKETDRLGSDASGRNAEIAMNELEQEASKNRIRQIEQEMAEIARLRDKGIIDQQTANDRLADSERSLLDLKLGLIEQEMAARRLASEAAIAELERVRQSAMGKIDLRESQEQLQSQQSILKGMDTDSLENLERQAKTAELKMQEQMQRELLQLAKNHQQQIENLRRQGLITEFDYEQRKLDVQKEVLDAEKNLVETRKQIKQAETEEVLRQIDLQIAAEQRRINELSASADAEKALRDHKTKMLDFDKTLMDARSGLESAKSNAVISKLQIQIEETDDPAKKAALQNELHEAKIAQLKREYQIQLQQLNLDKQRNQIAAEQLVAEAEINKLKAESARLEARMNLSKAQATKDAEQIAIAQSQLNIANKQAQIADLEIAAAQRNLEVQTENYNILKETLNIQHSTAMAEAEAAKRADSRAAAYKSIEDSANGAKSAMEQQANISRQVSRQIITNPVINGIEGDIEPRSFGGFRAKGGPVGMGKSYVVGEKGPELFIPSGSGTIIPNSKPTPVNSLNTPGAGSGNSSNKEISSRLDTLNNRIVQLANSPRNISVSTATPVSDTLNLITKVANTKYPDV